MQKSPHRITGTHTTHTHAPHIVHTRRTHSGGTGHFSLAPPPKTSRRRHSHSHAPHPRAPHHSSSRPPPTSTLPHIHRPLRNYQIYASNKDTRRTVEGWGGFKNDGIGATISMASRSRVQNSAENASQKGACGTLLAHTHYWHTQYWHTHTIHHTLLPHTRRLCPHTLGKTPLSLPLSPKKGSTSRITQKTHTMRAPHAQITHRHPASHPRTGIIHTTHTAHSPQPTSPCPSRAPDARFSACLPVPYRLFAEVYISLRPHDTHAARPCPAPPTRHPCTH